MSSLQSFEEHEKSQYKSLSATEKINSMKLSLNIEKTVPYTPVCSAADLDPDSDPLSPSNSSKSTAKKSYLPFPEDTESIEPDVTFSADTSTSGDPMSVSNLEMDFNHENLQMQRTDIFGSETRSKVTVTPQPGAVANAVPAVTAMGDCNSSLSLHIPGVSALTINTEGHRHTSFDVNVVQNAVTLMGDSECADGSVLAQNAVTLMGDIMECELGQTTKTLLGKSIDGDPVTLMGLIDSGEKVEFEITKKSKREK